MTTDRNTRCSACGGSPAPHKLDDRQWCERHRRYAAHVMRWVPTYVRRHNERRLMRTNRGSDTFATKEESDAWIKAAIENNEPWRIKDVWGDAHQFESRECPCWPEHFDPRKSFFDE
jgi:hypothetical protein